MVQKDDQSNFYLIKSHTKVFKIKWLKERVLNQHLSQDHYFKDDILCSLKINQNLIQTRNNLRKLI